MNKSCKTAKAILFVSCAAIGAPALAATSDTADHQQLEAIIVTAQRTEQNQQNVPISLTAISNKEIEKQRILSVKDISGLAPNLQVSDIGGQNNQAIAVRGIVSGVSDNTVDPKVGVYIDGVYIGRTNGALLDLADIQRIEVLRGPQGTLFGRNATLGALSVTTSGPSGHADFHGSVSVGNFNASRAKAVVDLPTWGPFSLKLAYMHDHIDGAYQNALAGEQVNLSLRAPDFGTLTMAKRLGDHTVDGVQATIRGDFGNVVATYRFDYSNSNSTANMLQSLGVIPDATTGALFGGIVSFQPYLNGITNISPDARLTTVANISSNEHITTQGHSLTLKYALSDAVTLTSISGYRRVQHDPSMIDLAATGGIKLSATQFGILLTPGIPPAAIPGLLFNPANLPGPGDSLASLLTATALSQQQVSQELQVAAKTHAFELVAGLFFFRETSPSKNVLGIFQPIVANVVVPTPFDAIFGSGTTSNIARNTSYAAYGQLTWHLSDTIDATGGLRLTHDKRDDDITSVLAGNRTLSVGDYQLSYTRVNYTGILSWHPDRSTTAYAKIASGYVAGGIQEAVPYQPESLTDYELGVKGEFFDRRLRLNLAGFYYNYTNLQTQDIRNGVQIFTNAGKVDLWGLEAEAQTVITRGLIFRGSVGYSNPDFKAFVQNGNDIAKVARFAYASKFNTMAALDYTTALTKDGALFNAGVDAEYRSGYFLTQSPVVYGSNALEDVNHRPGYWLVNARAGVAEIPVGTAKVGISAFARNLFNKYYIDFGAPVFSLSGSYNRGRTFGVEVHLDL